MSRKLTFLLAATLSAGLLLLPGCETPIDIDLNEGNSRVVFEGRITNDPGPYDLHVTRTTNYFGNDPVPQVSGAFFTVEDDMGTLDTLVEVEPGLYRTTKIQGQMEHRYTFRCTVDGTTYTASDEMGRITEIDTLVPYYQAEDIGFLDKGWYVIMAAYELPGVGDNYWFRFIRNDSLYNGASDLWFTDDRFADGQLAIFQYPYTLDPGDTCIAEVFGFRQPYYDYLLTTVQQLNSGGPFGTAPDNLKGNVDNGGLGFLAAIAVERDTVVIP
jgi:hypothetical protein